MNQLKLVLILLSLWGGTGALAWWKIRGLENQLVDTRIERDSTAAEHAELKQVNDSTWTRLAVMQREVKRLTGLAGAKPQVTTVIKVRVDTVESQSQGTKVATPEGWRLTGAMDTTPIHVRAQVDLRGDAAPLWGWQAWVDPLTIGVEVRCTPKPEAIVQVPSWAEVQHVETRLAVQVCPKDYTVKRGGLKFPWWVTAGGILGGYLYGKSKK